MITHPIKVGMETRPDLTKLITVSSLLEEPGMTILNFDHQGKKKHFASLLSYTSLEQIRSSDNEELWLRRVQPWKYISILVIFFH